MDFQSSTEEAFNSSDILLTTQMLRVEIVKTITSI